MYKIALIQLQNEYGGGQSESRDQSLSGLSLSGSLSASPTSETRSTSQGRQNAAAKPGTDKR